MPSSAPIAISVAAGGTVLESFGRDRAVVVPADVVERVNAFVGADGDIGCGGDLCHARELIRRDRLLEEIEARPVYRAHVSDSLLDAVALVGVGGDEHAISEHLADLARPRGVILGSVDADLDLVGGNTRGLLLFCVAKIAVKITTANSAQ